LTAPRIRVPIPAETGGEDRLVGSLTFRHAAYLAVATAGVAVMLLGNGSILGVSAGALVALIGVAGALCRPYGEPLDRLAVVAVGYVLRRQGHRRGGDEPVVDHAEMSHEQEEPPAPPEQPAPGHDPRQRVNPVVVRRVLAGLFVAGIAALAAERLVDRPTPPSPEPRIVIVPVPVPPPDPWEEVDRALNEWLNSLN
jgi:hypothetical protein